MVVDDSIIVFVIMILFCAWGFSGVVMEPVSNADELCISEGFQKAEYFSGRGGKVCVSEDGNFYYIDGTLKCKYTGSDLEKVLGITGQIVFHIPMKEECKLVKEVS